MAMLAVGLAAPVGLAVSVLTASQAAAVCTLSGDIVDCDDASPAGYDETVNDDRMVNVNAGATVGNNGSNPAAINLDLSAGNNDIDVFIEGADNGDAAAIVDGTAGANPVGARHGLQLLTGGGDVYVEMDPDTMVTGGGTGGDGFRIRTSGSGTIEMDLYGSVVTNATANDNGEAIDAQTTGDGDVDLNLMGDGMYRSNLSDVVVAGSSGGGTVNVTVAEGVTVMGGAGTGTGDDGILVVNAGVANVTVHGTVSGVGGSAVSVMNEAGLGDVEVNVVNSGNSLIGAESGIEIGTSNAVDHATITNSGLIEGNGVANAVIWANTSGNTLTIHNNGDGLIQATGAASNALIVQTVGSGGATLINNDATMIGVLDLAGGGDANANVVNNTSYETWTFTGVSEHGPGNSDAVNNTGRYNLFNPADDPGGSSATFAGVEFFNNGSAAGFGANGFINQKDGTANDLAIIEPTSPNLLLFTGAEGFSFLEQDVDLGNAAQSVADKLHIRGDVGGATGLQVVDLNNFIGAYNPVGVTVVEVEGITDLGDFFLDGGVIQKGLWTYDLFLNPAGSGIASANCDDNINNDCWVLASYPGFDLPQTLTVAQGMWHATADSWIDRASDLRTIYGESGGAGADIAYEPAVPTSHHGNTGIWARAIGQLAYRDVSYDIEMFNQIVTVDADYSEHLGAVQGGIDFALDHGQGTTVFGLLGGYAVNDVNFTDSGSSATVKAPHVGAYLDWLNGPGYVDLLVKADFLDVDLTIGGEDVQTKGLNLGGRLEAGYRHQSGHMFVEPVASIAFVHTTLDPVTVGGTDVEFNAAKSLRGRLGGRIGAHYDNGVGIFDPYVHAYVGSEFLGENSIYIDSGGGLTVTDDVSGTFGEVGGGFNMTHADRTGAIYGQGNYIFASGYHAGNVKAGVRVNW